MNEPKTKIAIKRVPFVLQSTGAEIAAGDVTSLPLSGAIGNFATLLSVGAVVEVFDITGVVSAFFTVATQPTAEATAIAVDSASLSEAIPAGASLFLSNSRLDSRASRSMFELSVFSGGVKELSRVYPVGRSGYTVEYKEEAEGEENPRTHPWLALVNRSERQNIWVDLSQADCLEIDGQSFGNITAELGKVLITNEI